MTLTRDLADATRDAETVVQLYATALELIGRRGEWPTGCVTVLPSDTDASAAHPAPASTKDDSRPDESGPIYYAAATEGASGLAEDARRLSCPGGYLSRRVAEAASPLWIEDLSRDPGLDDPGAEPGGGSGSGTRGGAARATLAVPLVGRRGVRAIFHFFDDSPRSVIPDELSELEEAGIQLGWMLELLERQARSRKIRHRLEKSVEAIQAVAAAGMDPDRVMQVTAEQAQELTGATSAGVFVRSEDDPDLLILRGASGNAVPYRGQTNSISETLSGHAFERGDVLVSNDTLNDPRVNQEVVRDTGLRSLIAVPLQADGDRVVGLLNVMSAHPHAFDEGDAQLLQLLSEQMGSAVDRARAFQSNERLLEDLSHTAAALEEALEEQEAILDASLHAIIAMDSELRVTLWSRAAEELYGWSEDEVVGSPLPFLPDFRRKEALENIGRVLDGATLRNLDVTHRRSDGSPVEVRLSAAPVRSSDGETGIVTVIMDMTEIRQVEARLRQSERMESIGRLAGGIAHDFNNMLTAMRGNADLLLVGDLEPEDRESVLGILEAVEKAESVTRQLLAYSRRQHLEARPIYPADAIREMSSLLERLLGERVALTFDLEHDAGPVLVDPAQLDQIVMNLVLNARDSMPEGGEIRIGCSRIDGRDLAFADLDRGPDTPWVELSVSDEGEGVPPEIRDRIFEPFFSTKSPGQGTGLGLATVYGVVHQSGGAIRLETTVGEGTTFRIYLPVAEES